MKFLLTVLSIAVALAGNAYALENTVQPTVKNLKNIPKSGLYVGNSYTYFNCGIVDWLKGMTDETKQPWNSRMNTISAGRLSFHPVEQYLAKAPLDPFNDASPKFDVVLLQAQSAEPIDPKAKENFQSAFAQHVKTIRDAGAEPAIVITWAKQDKPEDAKALADAITEEANKQGVFAIPVGLAVAESIKERPDLIMHQPDKTHPSAAGSYLYAAVLYSALFQKSPEGIQFLGLCDRPVSPEDAKYLQSLAWKTVKDFYGWK